MSTPSLPVFYPPSCVLCFVTLPMCFSVRTHNTYMDLSAPPPTPCATPTVRLSLQSVLSRAPSLRPHSFPLRVPRDSQHSLSYTHGMAKFACVLSIARLPPPLHPRSIDQATLRPRGPTSCRNGGVLLLSFHLSFCRELSFPSPASLPRTLASTRPYPVRLPCLSSPRPSSRSVDRPRPHSPRAPPSLWLASRPHHRLQRPAFAFRCPRHPRGAGLPFLCHRTPHFCTARRRPHASSLPHRPQWDPEPCVFAARVGPCAARGSAVCSIGRRLGAGRRCARRGRAGASKGRGAHRWLRVCMWARRARSWCSTIHTP